MCIILLTVTILIALKFLSIFALCSFHLMLPSVFHPENGVPIPLDVLAGVSSRGECVTEDGPNIKVYLQKHPRENKCVTVVTLEKYLSRGYSDECYDGINDMYFQDLDNGSYLRVATTEVFPGYPSPYITFGNTQSSLRFYQATSSMVKLERDVLEMTKYIYQLVDNVLKDSLECMKIVLLRKSHPGKKINCAKRRWSDLVDHGISDDRFLFPLGEHVPKDIPDSIVAQASKNKPYGHHSDTGPIKNCNHDDKQKWSHAKMMRIVSYGFAYEADDVNDHRTLNDDAVVSIKHGIPCLGENDFCTLIGYFCSSEKKFVRWTTIMGSAISIGSENHVHIQLPGSQGEMHHFIDSKKEKKDGVCRVVLSTRQLKPFQKTVDVQKSRVIGDSVRLHPANSHKTKNVVRLLMGKVHFPSASDDLENIKLGKKKLSGRQRTKMMNNNGQLKVELGAHRNGHLIEGEHKHRQFVIGMPNSISTESIGRCVNSGKALYQEGCTALFDRKDSSKVIVGPYVCKHEGESGYKLLRPGSKVDDLNALSGITANNRYHQVMNVDRCDIFNLHRIQKNSAEVGFNLARAIRAQHGSVHEKLKTMIMRGRGGASVLAGSLPIDSSNNKASRENPTHILSSNQNLTDKHAMALFGCCENQQCVNVFYENIYIGPFYIEDVHCKKHTIDEYREELKNLEQVLKELNGLAPEIFPNSIVTDNMKRELIGMTSMNICIRLVPLDVNFLLKWKDNNDVPWKVIDLHDEDIERPTFHVDQDEVMNLTLLGDAVEFTDSFNLLSKKHLSFLTDAAKERFEFIHVNDDDDVNYDEGDIDYIEQPLGTFNTSQFVGAAFHAAAFTMIKAFDESVLDADKCTMNPPRHFIMKNLVRNGQTYKDVLKKLNLKPVAMMPLHPPHLFGDPVILIALASCNSFEACLRLSNDDGEWIHRNGVNYLLNNDEAWAIIFKCIVCCLMNPSALLHISSRCGNLFLVPNPEGNEFDKFVKTVRLFEWEKRFLHPIFSKQFENGDIFIGFLDFLLTSGKHIFQLAVRCNTTKLSQCTRTGVVEYLLRHLNREDGPKLNSFHMQVIMRTIEACIHDPFGVVKVVPSGSGGLSAARCYVEQYDQHNIDDCGKSQKTKCELIPGWLVHWYNNDVQARLSSRNDLAMRQTNDELLVLGLEWSKQLDCLVHKIGIGRKLDPSDMEHCLCMLYTLHQHTLPSRNVGKESRIDGPKYLPIRHTVGECLARDLPFMSHVKEGYDEKMIAYQRLVKDDSYVHHNLPDLFRIDFLV